MLMIMGAILCTRQRTVTSILRVLGKANDKNFKNYHRFLSRDKWSGFKAAKVLLAILVRIMAPFVPGYLIIAIDETLERRQGKKIKAKGSYRDAVRSSESHVIKCFGLKWIVCTLIVKLPWCKRAWALPFFSVLAHSKKSNEESHKKHRTTIDLASQMVIAIMRWTADIAPKKKVVFLGDGAYASVKFLKTAISKHANVICRFRMDAVLFDKPIENSLGKRGPKPRKGKAQRKLKDIALDPRTNWTRDTVLWYAGGSKEVEYCTGESLWYKSGNHPIPIRWVLVRDIDSSRVEAICSTDQLMDAKATISMFVLRWNIEVTFEESRRHLGVETQRQWSNLAIERSTPCLFGIFSLTCAFGMNLWKRGLVLPDSAAWYKKKEVTFSDVLTAVRREILSEMNYSSSKNSSEKIDSLNFSREFLDSLLSVFMSAA